MRALTHVLFAFALSPARPSPVARVNETPRTLTVVLALTTVTPVWVELSVIWHEPVPPAVVHGFGPLNEPGPLTFENVICVPSGALTNPVPSLTLTWAVRT